MRLDYIHSWNVEVPSANAIQVSRMCEAFEHAGADVTLWYPHFASKDEVGDWRHHYGVRDSFAAHRLPVPMTRRLFDSPALPVLKVIGYTRLVARYRLRQMPTLVFTRCFAAAAFFPRALNAVAGSARPLVLFEAHEFPPTRRRLDALRAVDGIVAITQAAADEIIAALALPTDRVLVAPDGVPDAWFDQPLHRDTARAKLGLSAARPLAVYTGRFQPGTARLLAAIAERTRSKVDILAVGIGAAEARADVGIVAGLTIRDPVATDVARTYQAAADVLLMPHTGEVRWSRYTSPLKLFEYMAAARPIVASRLTALDEILQHEQNALLAPIGDAEALAQGVLRLVDEPDIAVRLAERARDDVRAHTWNQRAQRILDFTRSLEGHA